MKLLLCKLILFLISLLERLEYSNIKLDQGDLDKKILEHIDLVPGRYATLSHDGLVPMTHLYKTQPYDIWKLILSNGLSMDCADLHLVSTLDKGVVPVMELNKGDLVNTVDGPAKVTYIHKIGPPLSMFDCSIDTEEHLYYTNGILSHNTICTSIYMAHYLCFNYDRNMMLLANVGETMQELIDKIKTIMSNLPFFMKPGVLVNNVKTMKFDNKCNLFGKNTTKSPGIGYTIHFLYMDEFAHINPNFLNKFYKSLYPTIEASEISRIIITSTPNGPNKFYEIYRDAVAKKNSFNALRIDWWQIPGRDEAWMKRKIADLGSIEDFNQEYGNQFFTSTKLLLDPLTMKQVNKQVKLYENLPLLAFDEAGVEYEDLTWHPSFIPDEIKENDRFLFTIDISGGMDEETKKSEDNKNQGDYFVINIKKLIPMPIPMIQKRIGYRDETDFFSLLQVGLFRSNTIEIEEFAQVLEILIYKIFDPDQIKLNIEINFDGKRLIDKLERHPKFYEEMIVHTYHQENARHMKPGIKLNKKNKKEYCIDCRRLVRSGRILVNEKKTFDELQAFGVNNRGSFSSQVGHDDIAMTLVNSTVFFDTVSFQEMVEDIYDDIPDNYRKEIDIKLNNIQDEDTGDFDMSFMKDLL
jgi:hypothetical protein